MPIRAINGTARSTNLLVVGHHRPGPLKVNNKGKIRFIEAHAKRNCGYESFDFIIYQLFSSASRSILPSSPA
jgi:hypothetical protein